MGLVPLEQPWMRCGGGGQFETRIGGAIAWRQKPF
jgi:hypothetical protein